MASSSQPPKKARTVRTSSRSGLQNSALGTRNLMTIAALAVVGLIIVIPLSYAETASFTSYKSAIIAVATLGVWVIAYLIPSVVVRRPGSSLIAGVILGLIASITTPVGPAAILGNIIGALFVEIPLAATRYRRYTQPVFLTCGAFFGLCNGLMYLMVLKVTVGAGGSILLVVLSVLSGIVGAFITILLGRALARAGVGVERAR